MPTIDLTDAELAALVALLRSAIEEDRFPRALRLEPLRSALAKLDLAAAALQPPLAAKKPTLPFHSPEPPKAAHAPPEEDDAVTSARAEQ
jgi:hypothetical protein